MSYCKVYAKVKIRTVSYCHQRWKALILFLIFDKESFLNLFESDIDPVHTVKDKCRSDYDPNGFINVEHFCKKKQKDPNSQIKKYHEYTEDGMKLL